MRHSRTGRSGHVLVFNTSCNDAKIGLVNGTVTKDDNIYLQESCEGSGWGKACGWTGGSRYESC